MKPLFIAIFLILLIAIPATSQTETCLQNLVNPDIRILSQVINDDTILREYIIKIPSNYNENISTPLVINMHGFGDCASEYSETIGEFYDFSKLAEERNIITVYPQGAYRIEKDDTYWEPGDNGLDNIYENDDYFIKEMISDIQQEFNINSEMIYACGYSNGGMMAYSLACNSSDIFSAIGIMSGTMLEEDCTLQSSVPIIIFHGIEDEVLPYDGNLWYQSVEEVVSFWLEKNNIPANSLIESNLNDGKVSLNEYSGGNENSCLNFYTIYEEYDKPGGHVWFSDEIESATPNELMWNFFMDNCSTINPTIRTFDIEIDIFPNPVTDEINIKTEDNFDLRTTLYDHHGKQILSVTNSMRMQIDDLSSGLYLLEIEDSQTGQKAIERIVIER